MINPKSMHFIDEGADVMSNADLSFEQALAELEAEFPADMGVAVSVDDDGRSLLPGLRTIPDLLAEILDLRETRDSAYHERNQVVSALATLAQASGWRVGTARTEIPGWDPEWFGCVYIDLPTGQASWHFHDREAPLFAHLPLYPATWDGHTTPEKYERLAALGQPRDGLVTMRYVPSTCKVDTRSDYRKTLTPLSNCMDRDQGNRSQTQAQQGLQAGDRSQGNQSSASRLAGNPPVRKSNMTIMRAKMKINHIDNRNREHGGQTLYMNPVSRSSAYPEDGSDENNTYAKFSPSGMLSLTIANPALMDKFNEGEEYYLDFTPAVKA